MRLLYNIFINLYYFGILIASLFNKKAALWISGRKQLFSKLEKAINPNDKIVWFHASSLGEFEQGRPVIEAFRKKFPQYKILLTFFSPSGYEIRKNYKEADFIFYLHLDTISNAKHFINIVKPKMAFFIKYEYWFNFLNILFKKGIPVYMVSAIYRPSQHFFKWYGGWFRKHLKKITHFFVQNTESEILLKSIGIKNITVSGDTRFDRVYAISKEKKSFPVIEKFINNSNSFIAGSTWEKDEELIYELYKQYKGKLKFIIAPHKIDEAHINDITKRFNGDALRYSKLASEEELKSDVLIIDTIGMLSQIYRYATITYVGGGFGSGIHNILEAAVFGKPVIFGPVYHKFHEAKELIELGGAFSFSESEELIELVKKLSEDNTYLVKVSYICKNYVESKTGATKKIIDNDQVAIK